MAERTAVNIDGGILRAGSMLEREGAAAVKVTLRAAVDGEGSIACGRAVEEKHLGAVRARTLSDGKGRVEAGSGVIGEEDLAWDDQVLSNPGIVLNPCFHEIQIPRANGIGGPGARIECDAANLRRRRDQEIAHR